MFIYFDLQMDIYRALSDWLLVFLLALWTAIENCLSLISWSGLSCGVCHTFMTTVWTPPVNLNAQHKIILVACERQRDVLRGGTSATQRQKFHTDDVNQCLHNKSGSHGVSNANLFNFTFLLVDFGKVWCSSVNELQLNSNASSREDYIPKILAVLLEIHHVYIWPLGPFVFCLSFVNNG